MFFRKKKKEEMPVPVEDIHRLTQMGLSDKDIIKKLKSKGYSYEDIQKGMFQAVREEVSAPAVRPAAQRERREVEPLTFITEQEPEEEFNLESFDLESFEPEPLEAPSDINIDDLVETVVDEKIGGQIKKLESLSDDYHRLEEDIKKMEEKIKNMPRASPLGEDFQKKIDEVDSRVGALERMFRQLVPSLSRFLNTSGFAPQAQPVRQPAQQPPQQPLQQRPPAFAPAPQEKGTKKKYSDINSPDFYETLR